MSSVKPNPRPFVEYYGAMIASPDTADSALVAEPSGALDIRPEPDPTPAGTAIRLSLVIPTYNESKNIVELVSQVAQALQRACPNEHEIIVVDDDSPDRTWELARTLVERHPTLRVLRRRSERGLSTAVIRGWQVARGEVLAVIDGDLQHPSEVILDLWREIGRGADMAIASRHIEGGSVSEWNMSRRIVSRTAQILGLLILPGVVGRVSDPMSGFFMVRRGAIAHVPLNPLGYKILIEVLARGKSRWIAEVPYTFNERSQGESKLTWTVYIDYWRHLLRLRLSLLGADRFLRFALVGLSGVIVDMGVLFLLSDPSMLGWGLTRSKVLGSELAIINNFVWNDRWTFRDLAATQSSWRHRLRRFGKFQIICLAGMALNACILNVLFNVFGVNRYAANAIAIVVVTGWNYWLNLKLSWRIASATP